MQTIEKSFGAARDRIEELRKAVGRIQGMAAQGSRSDIRTSQSVVHDVTANAERSIEALQLCLCMLRNFDKVRALVMVMLTRGM